jgi:hypothetical protein
MMDRVHLFHAEKTAYPVGQYVILGDNSNPQNSWQKLGGAKDAWPHCRPWRASARLRPPPCPARFVLPSFFVMNSEACYSVEFFTVLILTTMLSSLIAGYWLRYQQKKDRHIFAELTKTT